MPKVTSQAASSTGRSRGRRVSTTLAEINVIPLVDVMLVLLIVFMVAAPMMQKGIEVNLPVAQNTGRMNETRVYITVPLSFRKDRRVYIDDEGIPLSALAERARQVMQARDEKEVFLRSDGQVQVQDVMDVFNSLKGGGVERVGMLTTTPRR